MLEGVHRKRIAPFPHVDPHRYVRLDRNPVLFYCMEILPYRKSEQRSPLIIPKIHSVSFLLIAFSTFEISDFFVDFC